MSQSYVQNCMAQQNQRYQGILKAGKTLSEASDIIMQGWESRNKTDDIISEKRSDGILGKERLYDPNTGDVYEFENGFYDKYRLDQNKYEMNNLQPLPNDNHALWTKPTLDEYQHLKWRIKTTAVRCPPVCTVRYIPPTAAKVKTRFPSLSLLWKSCP